MFILCVFVEIDLFWLDCLLVCDLFVIVFIVGSDGLLELMWMLVLYWCEGECIELCGYWVCVNLQLCYSGVVKVLVDGLYGYVLVSWYLDKEFVVCVLIWNYVVVELCGQLYMFDDVDVLVGLVGVISDYFEVSVGQVWWFDVMCVEYGLELCVIVGFCFQVEYVQLKLKLSQNYFDVNQCVVIVELEQLGIFFFIELVQWMCWYCEQVVCSG